MSKEPGTHIGNHEFVELNEFDISSASSAHDYFLVAGYPCTKQKFVPEESTIEAFLHPIVAVSKLSPSYQAESLSEEDHIIPGFNTKEMWATRSRPRTAPHPYGISGGVFGGFPTILGRFLEHLSFTQSPQNGMLEVSATFGMRFF